MARRLLLRAGVGERLLTTKLLILNGTGSRPTNIALSMLTGSIAVQRLVVADLLDVELGAEPLVSACSTLRMSPSRSSLMSR